MSGGGKGGSQSTSVEIPGYIKEASKRNLAKADEISKLGYVPYMGPDVAAFTPAQTAGFQNTADAASAFGMNAGMPSMPQPETFAGGFQGYSSFPMYDEALGLLAENRPGQYDYINDFFIDPVTGEGGYAPQQPQVQRTIGGGTRYTRRPDENDNVQSYHASRLDDGMRNFDRQFDAGGSSGSGGGK